MEPWRSKAPCARSGLVIWECDTIVYKAGWLQQGIVGPAQLGTAGYLYETPEKPMLTTYWTWSGTVAEAIEYTLETGLDRISEEVGGWFTRYPGRPDYFTHWGEGFRYAASVSGSRSVTTRTRGPRRHPAGGRQGADPQDVRERGFAKQPADA